MDRESRPVTSREYKVMLRAGAFAGDLPAIVRSADEFRKSLANGIGDCVMPCEGKLLTGEFAIMEGDKSVEVDFYDTDDCRLRMNDFVFRRRRPISGGKPELTLKRRHPDRFFVSGSKTGGKKKKFEEDIKATDTHEFIALYSLSGKKKADAHTRFEAVKDIVSLFNPLEEQLGEAYDPDLTLEKVGDFTARQTVLEGVGFQVSEETRAESALIVWHADTDGVVPAVVEFSFRYKDADLGEDTEPFTKEMASRSFNVLQALRKTRSLVDNWVDLAGPTKTAYVYSLKGNNQLLATLR